MSEYSIIENCAICGKEVNFPYHCTYCGQYFCDEHRLPEKHDCPNLPDRDWETYSNKQRGFITDKKTKKTQRKKDLKTESPNENKSDNIPTDGSHENELEAKSTSQVHNRDQTRLSTTTFILLIAILVIGLGGGYYITNNSLQPIIKDLNDHVEFLENERANAIVTIQELQNNVTKLLDDLEAVSSELDDALARISTLEEDSQEFSLDYDLTLLAMEPFEDVPIGSLPIGWVKDTGTTQDTIYVINERSYSGENCLRLHENGGDGENSKVNISNYEDCPSLVLDMMFLVDGGFADRGVFQFYNENNETITTIGCLLDMSWQIRLTDYFHDISGISTPESNQWYHVVIILDQRLQEIKIIIDGISSEWFSPLNSWITVDHLKFRGNYNYPADSFYDDFYIFKAESK